MQNSIKTKILDFLKNGQWFYGGQIEDHIRETDGHKASNASRRCRELEDEGKVESQYVHVEGVANKVVQYRLKNTWESGLMVKLRDTVNVGSTPTSPTKCCIWAGKNNLHSSSCPLNQKEKVKNALW